VPLQKFSSAVLATYQAASVGNAPDSGSATESVDHGNIWQRQHGVDEFGVTFSGITKTGNILISSGSLSFFDKSDPVHFLVTTTKFLGACRFAQSHHASLWQVEEEESS
jgi:hypothetical protein